MDHRPTFVDPLFQNHVAAKYYLLTYYLEQTKVLIGVLEDLGRKIDQQTAALGR